MTGIALDSYLQRMRKCFAQSDRRAAHRDCLPILKEMGHDPRVLPDIIRKNLFEPGFLERNRINPVLAMTIDKNPDFEFVMHGWMPLADRRTDISHQSIHHHGNLLLTSLAAFGPGYDSILFKTGVEIDPTTREAKMSVDRFYQNTHQNIEVVDTNTPHIVFYPPALSITYALWSTDKPANALAQNSVLRKYKKQLKKLLALTGMSRRVGVNDSRDLDFYVENGKTIALKERVMYPVGSHENFAQNLFHFLQVVGFDDHGFVRTLPEPTPAIARWKASFLAHEPIPDRFDPAHVAVARVNLDKHELLSAYGLDAEPVRAAA